MHLINRRTNKRLPRASLPWAELEAEADRQGCSVADVLFDRAGRSPEGLTEIQDTRPAARFIGTRTIRHVVDAVRRRITRTTPIT